MNALYGKESRRYGVISHTLSFAVASPHARLFMYVDFAYTW